MRIEDVTYTKNFLRCFGVNGIEQLPPLPQKEDNAMVETTMDEMIQEEQPLPADVFGPEEEEQEG